MRSHLSYANVMATLGVFIALGGSSYAAVKLTGKDVRNGSLTGKDIKKKSVALNRLKGTLPTGPAGPAGPQGPKGDPGTPAPEGVTRLAVPVSQWESADPELIEENASSQVDFVVVTQDPTPPYTGTGFVSLHPQLPVANGAGRMRVLAVRLCTSGAATGMDIDHIYMNQFRAGDVPSDSVAQFEVADPPEDPTCTRYALAEPFLMEGDDFINVRIRLVWSDNATQLRLTNTTIEYDRVS